MVQSCISYPGSKRNYTDELLKYIPEGITDWREPFFGSGSVTLAFMQSDKGRDCKKFTVGDLSPELWSMWYGLQQDSETVLSLVKSWWKTIAGEPSAMEGMTDAEIVEQFEPQARQMWHWVRNVDTTKMNLQERAARMFLCNQISYSALGDSGSLSRERFAKFRRHFANDFETVRNVVPYLKKMEILNSDFRVTMDGVDEQHGFVFLDPPYMNQESSGLYGRNGDTHRGFPHKEFADYCISTKAKWLITYDDSIGVRKLFNHSGIWTQPFFINYTLANGRQDEDALNGEELLIANYDINSVNGSYDDLQFIL